MGSDGPFIAVPWEEDGHLYVDASGINYAYQDGREVLIDLATEAEDQGWPVFGHNQYRFDKYWETAAYSDDYGTYVVMHYRFSKVEIVNNAPKLVAFEFAYDDYGLVDTAMTKTEITL